MKSFTHKIKDELGLHARPASMIVTESKKYNSVITIACGEKEAKANEMIKLMMLALKAGDDLTVTIEGEDEDKACEEFRTFCEANV